MLNFFKKAIIWMPFYFSPLKQCFFFKKKNLMLRTSQNTTTINAVFFQRTVKRDHQDEERNGTSTVFVQHFLQNLKA